jgi:hypothetical protein
MSSDVFDVIFCTSSDMFDVVSQNAECGEAEYICSPHYVGERSAHGTGLICRTGRYSTDMGLQGYLSEGI